MTDIDHRASESLAGSTAGIIFWVVACFIFFWAVGERSLWGSEDRWAEVTREMFLTRDFFHPRINGEPYFDKPLLGYWFIALASVLSGRLNEWSVRVASAVSGLLVLWGTVHLGRKLWSNEVGRIAGWILLTTYGILFWARMGQADMENLAAVTLAVAWYWTRRDRSEFVTYLVFYLVCFMGAHTKGLTALVVPLVAVVPDLVREQRWRHHVNLAHFLALALGALTYLAPFFVAELTRGEYHSSGLSLAFQENIQRFLSPFDHIKPFYSYIYDLAELFLPWTPLLLGAFLGAATSWKNLDRKTRWLLESGALIFLFYSFPGSRRVYYILPILPFCALLVAVFLTTTGNTRVKRIAVGAQIGVLALLSIIEVLSPAIWPIIKRHLGFVPPRELMVSTPIIGFLALVIFALWWLCSGLLANCSGTDRRIAGLLGAAAILMGGFFCWQHVSLDVYRTERPFARELKNHISGVAPREIAFYREVGANVIFYLDLPEPVLVLHHPGSVRSFLNSSKGTKVLVAQRRDLDVLLPELRDRHKELPSLSEKVYPWVDSPGRKLVIWKIDADGGLLESPASD